MAYERHEWMIAPAREGAELWRTALGVAATAVIYISLLVTFYSFVAQYGSATIEDTESAIGALVTLFSIAALAAGPMVISRSLHNRTASSLFGPSWSVLVTDFWRVLKVMAVLYAVLWILPPYGFDLARKTDLWSWLALLPLTLMALLIQTGSEEVVFRGYLQSQLAARFRSPLIWMVLPSALFAWGHYLPSDYGEYSLWIALTAFFFGLAAADLTARAGNLGPAIAMHFVNNVGAVALVAPAGDFSGLALWTFPMDVASKDVMWSLVIVDMGFTAVSWLAARLALRL